MTAGPLRRCENCRRWYRKTSTDEETLEEFRKRFPDQVEMYQRAPGGFVLMCTDCDRKMWEWWNSLPPEERNRINRETSAARPTDPSTTD